MRCRIHEDVPCRKTTNPASDIFLLFYASTPPAPDASGGTEAGRGSLALERVARRDTLFHIRVTSCPLLHVETVARM